MTNSTINEDEWEFAYMMTRRDGTQYPVYRHRTDSYRFLPLFTNHSSWSNYLQEQMDNGTIT